MSHKELKLIGRGARLSRASEYKRFDFAQLGLAQAAVSDSIFECPAKTSGPDLARSVHGKGCANILRILFGNPCDAHISSLLWAGATPHQLNDLQQCECISLELLSTWATGLCDIGHSAGQGSPLHRM